MQNISEINTKLNISFQIKRNLTQLKEDINDQECLDRIKNLKKFKKGFSLSGLTICAEDTSTKATELDSWYGYSIIKTKYLSELGWVINKLTNSFRHIFSGMEGREYFYDLLLVNLKKDCEDKKSLNAIFNNLIISSELILAYYENDKVFSDELWIHLRDKNKLN